ncbi:uncharacterized protein LOC129922666 [Biomphalaria glabrata]|uniref:Uncharacterized protein LOC129922666 n=1 Tax=Biomphalaria glabrata TaxID=6526 RepID=A0A9W2YRF8_BIOGL|nr:uncharacterized protein LOC129922666 [Biomphalaria glabrata]
MQCVRFVLSIVLSLFVYTIQASNDASHKSCALHKDYITQVEKVGTAVDYSICLPRTSKAGQSELNITYNDVLIPRDEKTADVYFTSTALDQPSNSLNFTLHIRNFTVYNFGNSTVQIFFGESLETDLTLVIKPPGEYSLKMYTKKEDENEVVVVCEANWFPKMIEIKDKLTNKVLATLNNSLNQVEKKTANYQNVLPPCRNEDVYVCLVTDFQNNVKHVEHVNKRRLCAVKFCDGQTQSQSLNATIGKSLNFSVCLNLSQDFIVNISTKINNVSYKETQAISSNKSIILYFYINEMLERYIGNHTLSISTSNSSRDEELNKNIEFNVYDQYEYETNQPTIEIHALKNGTESKKVLPYEETDENTEANTHVYILGITASVLLVAILLYILILFKRALFKRRIPESDYNIEERYRNIKTKRETVKERVTGIKKETGYLNVRIAQLDSFHQLLHPDDTTRTSNEHVYTNSIVLDSDLTETSLGDSSESGRYVSSEGLIYVTLTKEGLLKRPLVLEKENSQEKIIYASLDMNRTGKTSFGKHKQRKH